MLDNKKIRHVLIAVFSVLFAFSTVMLIITVIDREQAKSDFKDLAELVEITDNPSGDVNDTTSSEPSQTVIPSQPSSPAITRDIPLLKEMNSECVGWVYIQDTKINYPVMYSPENPEKYLKRNFYNKYSVSGVPFIDVRCGLNSTNIILYGHNMKNLTMFGGLRKYLNKNYLNEHPIIEFETLKGLNYYKIIEVRKTDIYDSWYTHNLDGKQDGKEYLTLSTCYGTNKKARLLIIAEKQVITEE